MSDVQDFLDDISDGRIKPLFCSYLFCASMSFLVFFLFSGFHLYWFQKDYVKILLGPCVVLIDSWSSPVYWLMIILGSITLLFCLPNLLEPEQGAALLTICGVFFWFFCGWMLWFASLWYGAVPQ